MNAEVPPPPPPWKPILTEERATFLFGATVETGETPDTFTDRVIAELKRAGIFTEEGKLHPRLRKRKAEEKDG